MAPNSSRAPKDKEPTFLECHQRTEATFSKSKHMYVEHFVTEAAPFGGNRKEARRDVKGQS